MWVAICLRIHDEGFPSSQRQLAKEAQEWFALRYTEVPDERTIRRKIQLLYTVHLKAAA